MNINKYCLKKSAFLALMLLMSSTASSQTLKDFDNMNTKIHDNETKKKLKVSETVLSQSISEQKIIIQTSDADEFVSKNNNTVKKMESDYSLKLNKLLYSIKAGKSKIQDIKSPFMKKKITSLLLLDENQMETLLREMDEAKDIIDELTLKLASKDDENAIKLLELTKVNKKLVAKVKILKSKYKNQIKILKQKLTNSSRIIKNNNEALSSMENPLNLDTIPQAESFDAEEDDIVIKGMRVHKDIRLGEYRKMKLSFFYKTPFISEEKIESDIITLIKPKSVSIENFGTIVLKIEDGFVKFFNDEGLIKKIKIDR
jgi:hypothetical protein